MATILSYKKRGFIYLSPCPFGFIPESRSTIPNVHSAPCENCKYYGGEVEDFQAIVCFHKLDNHKIRLPHLVIDEKDLTFENDKERQLFDTKKQTLD